MPFSFDPINNIVSAEVVEPSVNSNGTPLTNLKSMQIYYMWNSAPYKGVELGATTPEGGTTQDWVCSVPVPDQTVMDLEFWVTATNTNDESGPASAHEIVHCDRRSVPAAPQFK